MSKNLILYYSRRGENYLNGSIKSLAKGNTEICAEYIQNAVGGDMFEIRTEEKYSDDYTECTQQAQTELRNNARPKLEEYLNDVSQYDNIFVLGPCWWGTYPTAVFSQLERLDLTGKKILPLMTHEGSGMGNSQRDLRRICKGAEITDGLAVHGADAERSEKTVSAWAKKSI